MTTQPLHYGFVKSIISGDCLVVLGAAKPGCEAPPEKVLVLSGIQAPKLCRSRSNNTPDEPWAWESREFLRKKCIGKKIGFHSIAGSGTGREYAHLYLDGQNITDEVIKAGMAVVKVPPSGARLTTEKEALLRLQEEAKQQGLGMHGKNPEEHVRVIDWAPNTEKLYAKYHGKLIPAVVNQIRDATCLRCEVLGSVSNQKKAGRHTMIVNLSLSGARAPAVPISHEYRMSQHRQKLADDPSYEGTEPEEEKAPEYALEAASFVETRLLNRDVEIIIQGMDMANNIYGVIKFAKGNITTKLLEMGFARFVPWTAVMNPDKDLLSAAASVAKAKKLRLGALEDPPVLPEFQGRVVFVQSGDTITVDDGTKEVKVSLASIRAPRLGNSRRNEKNAPCAMEAREYLRHRLIGKKVRVIPEYTREGADDRLYSTVLHDKNVNMGIALVAAGLAEVIPHRQDDPRSLHYCKLMEASLAAKKTSQGIYNGKSRSQNPIVDLTDRPRRGKDIDATTNIQGSKARQYLPFLQRDKVCQAVVEYCFSASRLKVLVPKENCMISLALVGIKTPRSNEEFGDEANEYVKKLCLQHNVRIEIETIDKGDNFIGSLWIGPNNLGVSLLQQGYATIVGFSAERSPHGTQLLAAEEEAKAAKRGIYKNWVEPVAVTAEDGKEEVALRNQMEVRVTEVTDAVSFCFQVTDDPNAKLVQELMEQFNESVPESKPENISKGDVLAGLYSDDVWYRVRADGANAAGQMRVYFIDYGNHDILEVENLRELPEETKSISGLARPAFLAGLKAPTKNSEHFEGAAVTFNDYAFDRVLHAKTECVDKSNKVHLTLTDPEHKELTINSVLLRDGWCRVQEKPEWKLKSLVEELKKDEEIAKKARLNIWEYGDVSDEEEEESNNRFDGRTGKPITR